MPFTTTRLTPDTGHVHLYVDGHLIAMATSTMAQLPVPPGQHTLVAEFVAADHGPFRPRVTATVRFEVRPG